MGPWRLATLTAKAAAAQVKSTYQNLTGTSPKHQLDDYFQTHLDRLRAEAQPALHKVMADETSTMDDYRSAFISDFTEMWTPLDIAPLAPEDAGLFSDPPDWLTDDELDSVARIQAIFKAKAPDFHAYAADVRTRLKDQSLADVEAHISALSSRRDDTRLEYQEAAEVVSEQYWNILRREMDTLLAPGRPPTPEQIHRVMGVMFFQADLDPAYERLAEINARTLELRIALFVAHEQRDRFVDQLLGWNDTTAQPEEQRFNIPRGTYKRRIWACMQVINQGTSLKSGNDLAERAIEFLADHGRPRMVQPESFLDYITREIKSKYEIERLDVATLIEHIRIEYQDLNV